jgi:flagellar motor component MotA
MSLIRTIIGVFFFFGFILLGQALSGGQARSLAHITVFMLVAGPTLGLVIISYGLRQPALQIAKILRGETLSDGESKSLQGVCSLTTQAGSLCGFVGTILGLIHTLQNLSDPKMIGHGIAVAFVSLLYGAGISALAFGFGSSLKQNAATNNDADVAEEPKPETTEKAVNHAAQIIGGFVLFFGSVLGINELEGGHLNSLISASSFILVGGCTISMVVMAHGLRAPGNQFLEVLKRARGNTTEIDGALRLMIHAGPLSGLIGAIIGMISVMENLDNPSRIGPGMAVTLISLLYGAVVASVAHSLRARVAQASNPGETSELLTSSGNATQYIMTGFFILLFCLFLILYSIAQIPQ